MYKLINNNMIVDLLEESHYVRYLKNSKRWVLTDKWSAHGVMGSDGNTIYLLRGKKCAYPKELKTVEVYEINKEEFDSLSIQFSIQHQENENLRNEIQDLRSQLEKQNSLLQQILSKL